MTKPTLRLPAVAIDTGFFHTKYTLGGGDSPHTMKVADFPSYAVLRPTADGVRKTADDRIVLVDGMRYLVGASAKSEAGDHQQRMADDNYPKSDEYKAITLAALGDIAESHKTKSLTIGVLVVGLPVQLWSSLHAHVAKSFRGTHAIHGLQFAQVEVIVEHVEVIPQPTGALYLHYESQMRTNPNFTSLVLDMGGGTFDWYLSIGGKAVGRGCGSISNGTLKCASEACRHLNPAFATQPRIIDAMDSAIHSNAATVTIGAETHSMERLWPVIDKTLSEATRQLKASIGRADDVNSVLVTGGGAKLVLRALERELPHLQNRVKLDEEPRFSNVRGFQVWGRQWARTMGKTS